MKKIGKKVLCLVCCMVFCCTNLRVKAFTEVDISQQSYCQDVLSQMSHQAYLQTIAEMSSYYINNTQLLQETAQEGF